LGVERLLAVTLLLVAGCGLAFLATGSSSDDDDESEEDEVALLFGNLLVGTLFGLAAAVLVADFVALSAFAGTTFSCDDFGVVGLAVLTVGSSSDDDEDDDDDDDDTFFLDSTLAFIFSCCLF
jgi:hypothetical protein